MGEVRDCPGKENEMDYMMHLLFEQFAYNLYQARRVVK